MIKVKVLGGREYVIDTEGSDLRVKELMRRLGLNTEEYVVTKSGEVITEEDVVRDGDELVLYPVVSGG